MLRQHMACHLQRKLAGAIRVPTLKLRTNCCGSGHLLQRTVMCHAQAILLAVLPELNQAGDEELCRRLQVRH